MYSNVILEGPDGGGKTTLIQHMVARGFQAHSRASHSIRGPVGSLDDWVDDNPPGIGGYVFDRHPLISEPIYGPICRGGMPGRFNLPSWIEEHLRRLAADTVLVLCLPPLAIGRENAMTVKQMPGVIEYYDEIYEAYLKLWWPGVMLRYDYTRRWNVGELMGHIDQVIDETAIRKVTY